MSFSSRKISIRVENDVIMGLIHKIGTDLAFEPH